MDSYEHDDIIKALEAADRVELARRLAVCTAAHLERLRELGHQHQWSVHELVMQTMQAALEQEHASLRRGQTIFGFLAALMMDIAAAGRVDGSGEPNVAGGQNVH